MVNYVIEPLFSNNIEISNPKLINYVIPKLGTQLDDIVFQNTNVPTFYKSRDTDLIEIIMKKIKILDVTSRSKESKLEIMRCFPT